MYLIKGAEGPELQPGHMAAGSRMSCLAKTGHNEPAWARHVCFRTILLLEILSYNERGCYSLSALAFSDILIGECKLTI